MNSHKNAEETARSIRRRYRENGSAMANESRKRVQDFLRQRRRHSKRC